MVRYNCCNDDDDDNNNNSISLAVQCNNGARNAYGLRTIGHVVGALSVCIILGISPSRKFNNIISRTVDDER
jgi:hypothetical protein